MKSPRGLKRKGKRKMKKTGGNRPSYSRNLVTRQSEMQQQQQQQQQRQLRVKEERDRYEHQLGPAQGTKIERERGDLESIPEQSTAREPEPAQEPAGPDQTLPSPTSGQGQSATTTTSTNEPQNLPPPKERVATSYINVSIHVLFGYFRNQCNLKDPC